MKSVILFFAVTFCSPLLVAQTGPGGIGNTSSNALWLRADAGTSTTTNAAAVSSWGDGSGNANDVSQSTAVQQPTYRTNIMNGYPSILFDNNSTSGQNDFFSGADNSTLDNTNGLTIFTVTRPNSNSGNARSIVAKRTNVGVNQAYMFFYYTGNYMWTDIISNDNRFSTNPTAFTSGNNYLHTLLYDGTLSAPNRSKVYLASSLLVTATESGSTIPDYASPLIIGATHVGDNRAFDGYISEIIIFRVALTETQRIIVDNYLSAKYNIALSANDYYSMDTPANGNYDHEVAGIGRRLPTEYVDDAQGTSFVRISNPSALSNNEYLLWGHDNGSIVNNNTSDVDGTIIQSRLNRIWRVDETGDVGTVTLAFDVSTFTSVVGTDLRLLIDRDGDGFFDNDITPQTGSFSSGVVTFTNVDFQAGDRFTLGSVNALQTPLPVEMLYFDVEREKEFVRLNWTTASETNNDFFELQKSTDAQHWEVFGQVPGSGHSNIVRNYTSLDVHPAEGINYYRLRQQDFNGASEFSQVRAIQFENETQDGLLLYPNPGSGNVTLCGINNSEITGSLNVYSVDGKLIYSTCANRINKLDITISEWESGTYLFIFSQDQKSSQFLFIKE